MSISISKVLTVTAGNQAGPAGLGGPMGPGPGVAGGLSGLMSPGAGAPMAGSMGGALGEGGPVGLPVGIPMGVPMTGSMGGPVGGGSVAGVASAGAVGGPEGPGNPKDSTELSGEEAIVKLCKLGGKAAAAVISGLMSSLGPAAGGAPGPK